MEPKKRFFYVVNSDELLYFDNEVDFLAYFDDENFHYEIGIIFMTQSDFEKMMTEEETHEEFLDKVPSPENPL